jgi:hypothetical protein
MCRKFALMMALVACAAAAVAGGKPAAADAIVITPLQPSFTFPDGERGFALTTSGGFVNPEVIVGFNPQPDPPGDTPANSLNLVNPGAPMLHSGAQANDFGFGISFLGIGHPSFTVSSDNAGFHFTTVINDRRVSFIVTASFADDQGNPAASVKWGAFNPQPDPPGDFIGAFVQVADADASFEITENGAPLSFAPVPEPASLSLFCFGIAGLAIARRHRAMRCP